jgi:hypothetical protein
VRKLQTLQLLQGYLDNEFSWRLKEIADVKMLARQAISFRQRTLVRAGVPLLYAHWEGFVKNSSLAYLNFVSCQGLSYRDLETCFVVFGVKRALADLTGSRKSKLNIEAAEFFRSRMDDHAILHLGHAVDTESNLKSDVFESIVVSLGIDPARYEPRYNLINESLLKRRNSIAHGEYVDLDNEEYRGLADEVLQLMRWYKTDVENAATLKDYKRVGS